MTVMTETEAKDQKQASIDVLQLLLPKYKAMFTPRSLVLTSQDGNVTIDENNFEQLQDALRLIFCSKNGPMD